LKQVNLNDSPSEAYCWDFRNYPDHDDYVDRFTHYRVCSYCLVMHVDNHGADPFTLRFKHGDREFENVEVPPISLLGVAGSFVHTIRGYFDHVQWTRFDNMDVEWVDPLSVFHFYYILSSTSGIRSKISFFLSLKVENVYVIGGMGERSMQSHYG